MARRRTTATGSASCSFPIRFPLARAAPSTRLARRSSALRRATSSEPTPWRAAHAATRSPTSRSATTPTSHVAAPTAWPTASNGSGIGGGAGPGGRGWAADRGNWGTAPDLTKTKTCAVDPHQSTAPNIPSAEIARK